MDCLHTHFQTRRLLRAPLLALWLAMPALCAAQTLFGVGDPTGAGAVNANRLLSVNAATGVATNIAACPNLSFNSRALAISPVDGLAYYFEDDNAANPQLNSINPGNPLGTGCANGVVRNTTLPADIQRATFCPDGRLYASSDTAQFFEVNAATGATIRTLNFTGLTTGGNAAGGGDLACASTGDLYITSLTTTGGGNNNHTLFRANAAAVQGTASGGNVAVVVVGALGVATNTNGLAEVDAGLAGCAAAPAPCLRTSSATQILAINSLTGAGTVVGNHGIGDGITDLGRAFATNVAIVKTGTPSVVLQGQTVNYTLNISNTGPGVAASVTVTDVFAAASYANVAWNCTVVQAGTPTLVTTACAAASGTGSINNTVSLSLGGAVRYSVTAPLTSTFAGTLTNTGAATVSVLITDTPTSNNLSSITTTVMPAARLEISKTNGTNTAVAGTTVAYTVTVANYGPANAPGTVFQDPDSPGLDCIDVAFTSTPPGSVTVSPASFTISDVENTGVTLTPTFPANSTATFRITCTVTATGQ